MRIQEHIYTQWLNLILAATAAVEMLDHPGWYLPPTEAFVHPEVVALLDSNNLGHVRDKFEAIGVYTHADVVNLSLAVQGIEGWALKQDLLQAFELPPQSVDWHRLLAVLTEYVKPI